MTKHALECIDFRAVNRGTLRGFATVRAAELRLVLHDVALHETKSGARWAAPPSRPMVDTATKTVILDRSTNKIAYTPSISFDDAKTREAFSSAVWHAVSAFAPEVTPPIAQADADLFVSRPRRPVPNDSCDE